MIRFVDRYRAQFGVEPICKVLQLAPSTYHRHKQLEREPDKRSDRAKRDEELELKITEIWEESFRNYGILKIWHQLLKDKEAVARCTVERLMRRLGIEGVRRGKKYKTTIPDEKAFCPLDLVNREFKAQRPNQLWVADITYVSTWAGMVFVAFVVDVFSRRIVGWRAMKNMRTDLILDALEQALWARGKPRGVTHHSDRGSQYLSIAYSDRLNEAGFNASVGSVGDSYDNALAETINGLYKAEVIHKEGPWKNLDQVELATATWVEWFNNRRLYSMLDYVSPAEYEELFYQQTESARVA